MARPWTRREDRLIRKATAANRRYGIRPSGDGRLRQLAERIERTYNAVRIRAWTLGERSFDPERAKRRAWTPEDDAIIATRHGEGSGALAERLGRSRYSVQKRASRLEISLRP